jgi:hypothetical protein
LIKDGKNWILGDFSRKTSGHTDENQAQNIFVRKCLNVRSKKSFIPKGSEHKKSQEIIHDLFKISKSTKKFF